MIIPPDPMQLFDGQRAFIAFGAPWKDAVIALMDPRCGYDPWEYDEEMRRDDVLITVIKTEPRVFGCIELIGWDWPEVGSSSQTSGTSSPCLRYPNGFPCRRIRGHSITTPVAICWRRWVLSVGAGGCTKPASNHLPQPRQHAS